MNTILNEISRLSEPFVPYNPFFVETIQDRSFKMDYRSPAAGRLVVESRKFEE